MKISRHDIPDVVKSRGGGGGTLIYAYIRRLGHFLGFKILIFIFFFFFFRKKEYFWGIKILWIFFGGSSQNWTIFRGHFYAF